MGYCLEIIISEIVHNDNNCYGGLEWGSRDIQEYKNNIHNAVKDFCFLATCLYLDPDLDLEIACGLIGIDNCLLVVHFKKFKVLRLHAILHDACGFVHDYG